MADESYVSLFDSIPTWVMLVPIFICSVIILAVIIERLIFYRRINHDYRLVVRDCVQSLSSGKASEAADFCRQYDGPVAGVIQSFLSGMERGVPGASVLQDAAERAVRSVEKYTGLVSTIATIAPMFGLFGTVTGMMKSFSALTRAGQFAYDMLARGIAEALITTALGLMVAIPAWIFYNYMVSKVEYYIKEIEHIANNLALAGEAAGVQNG